MFLLGAMVTATTSEVQMLLDFLLVCGAIMLPLSIVSASACCVELMVRASVSAIEADCSLMIRA